MEFPGMWNWKINPSWIKYPAPIVRGEGPPAEVAEHLTDSFALQGTEQQINVATAFEGVVSKPLCIHLYAQVMVLLCSNGDQRAWLFVLPRMSWEPAET